MKNKTPKPLQTINFKVSVEIPAESPVAHLTAEERAAVVQANIIGKVNYVGTGPGASRVIVTRTK